MADPLATKQDLLARGMASVPDNVDVALAVASSLIREAAGCDISEETSTVTITGTRANLLALPGPVTAVSAVSISTPIVIGYPVFPIIVVDFEILPNGLWRQCGWSPWGNDVAKVTVTYTHGLATVPVDIVDLTCNLAKAWLNHAAAGGGSTAGVTQWGVDDARESYTDEYAGQISPAYIPDVTRQWLARRFNGGAVVVSSL